jgi:hypothetical protein
VLEPIDERDHAALHESQPIGEVALADARLSAEDAHHTRLLRREPELGNSLVEASRRVGAELAEQKADPGGAMCWHPSRIQR